LTPVNHDLQTKSPDTSEQRRIRIGYVLDIDTSWILAATYPQSIGINYFNFKKYFIGYLYDTPMIHKDTYKILHMNVN